MKQPLRIGILAGNSFELPAWEYEMLQQISKNEYASICTIIISENQEPAKKSFLYRLFTKFEDSWFGNKYDAVKKINIKNIFSEKNIPADNIQEIESCNLDVIYISVTANYQLQQVLPVRYGCWKIIVGKGKYFSATPPAFWEVMNGEASTGSSLIICNTKSENQITVYSGSTITIPYSVKNNLRSLLWKSSSFLPYRLKELYDLSSDLFFEKYKCETIYKVSQLKSPGNGLMIWFFLKNSFSYLIYKVRNATQKKRFTILFSNQPYNDSKTNFAEFKTIALTKDNFIADPFIIKKDDKQFIFFEEFLYSKNKAHISVKELLKNGDATESVIVLDKPYHLSYPFVFEWENEFYMIPETAANNTVELYRCKRFPDQWDFVMNLMENISLIDCTLHFENGKWWMFACTQNHPVTTSNDQLLLFYSENLFSNNWIAHPQNPVATDISNCRPAGKIFSKDGKLYRPAQNNASQQYGYALKINCIEILNEKEYKETEVFEILPGVKNNLLAVHMFNFTDDTVVIDGIVK